MISGRRQPIDQRNAVQAGHDNVEDDTVRLDFAVGFLELLGVGERRHLEIVHLADLADELTKINLIIHDKQAPHDRLDFPSIRRRPFAPRRDVRCPLGTITRTAGVPPKR